MNEVTRASYLQLPACGSLAYRKRGSRRDCRVKGAYKIFLMTLELSRQVPASGSVWRLFFSKPCCSCRRYHGFAANLASTFAFLIILTLAACFMDFVAASGRRFLRAGDRHCTVADPLLTCS